MKRPSLWHKLPTRLRLHLQLIFGIVLGEAIAALTLLRMGAIATSPVEFRAALVIGTALLAYWVCVRRFPAGTGAAH